MSFNSVGENAAFHAKRTRFNENAGIADVDACCFDARERVDSVVGWQKFASLRSSLTQSDC